MGEEQMYADHRVKKKDFKNLANYNLSLRGKKLIKSSTTVMNRGKPSNIRSHAAKAHIGNALLCTKTPPKTGENDTISTHYQRAQKKVKHCIFDENLKNNSMYISMDDKAYLRPGTDVGFRVVRNKKLYDELKTHYKIDCLNMTFVIQIYIKPPRHFGLLKVISSQLTVPKK